MHHTVDIVGPRSWKPTAHMQVLIWSDIADPELMLAQQMQTDKQAFCLIENQMCNAAR